MTLSFEEYLSVIPRHPDIRMLGDPLGQTCAGDELLRRFDEACSKVVRANYRDCETASNNGDHRPLLLSNLAEELSSFAKYLRKLDRDQASDYLALMIDQMLFNGKQLGLPILDSLNKAYEANKEAHSCTD